MKLLDPPTTPQPDLTIAVPSYGRAGRVLTEKMLDPEDFVVVVPPEQIDDYHEAQPKLQLMAYPLPEGDMSRKAGWLYETFGDVLILDDDLDRLQHNEHVGGEKVCNLRGKDAKFVFDRTAWECAQAGCYLFGYGDGDVRNYDDMHPFRLKGLVAGNIGLLRDSGITFNSEIRSSEDFWVSLLNAHLHRIAWMDWRYTPNGPATTFTGGGGMATVRTMGTEEQDFHTLRRYFGDAVQRKQSTTRAARRHEWQRTIVLPY